MASNPEKGMSYCIKEYNELKTPPQQCPEAAITMSNQGQAVQSVEESTSQEPINQDPAGAHQQAQSTISKGAERHLCLARATFPDDHVTKRKPSPESDITPSKRRQSSRAAAVVATKKNANFDSPSSEDDSPDDLFKPSATSSPRAGSCETEIVDTKAAVEKNRADAKKPNEKKKADERAASEKKKAAAEKQAAAEKPALRDGQTGRFPRSVANQYSGVRVIKNESRAVGLKNKYNALGLKYTPETASGSAPKSHRKKSTSKQPTTTTNTSSSANKADTTTTIAFASKPTPTTPIHTFTSKPSTTSTTPTIMSTSNPTPTAATASTLAQATTMQTQDTPIHALLKSTGHHLGALKSRQDITAAKLAYIASLAASAAEDDAAGVRLTDYRELLETISQFAAGAAAELREGVDGVVSDVAGGLGGMDEVGALGEGVGGGYVDRKEVLGALGAGDDWEAAVAEFDKANGV